MEKEKENVSQAKLTPEQIEEINLFLTNCNSSRKCVVDDVIKSSKIPNFIKQVASNLVSAYINCESCCLFVINENKSENE